MRPLEEKVLIKKVLQDPILLKLSTLAKEKGVSLYLVGGYLRDLVLETESPFSHHPTLDYDFALPAECSSFISVIEQAFQFHFFKVGKEEAGTITYRMVRKGLSIDLTFLQGKNLEEDLQRRDFTINAMAFSLRDETWHTVPGAFDDLRKKILRSVSPHSIDQDPLRMLRAIRYLCTLDGFTMDITLEEEIASKKELIRIVPVERIRMELDRILLSPRPGLGVTSLYELGLLVTLMPEFSGLEGLAQGKHHHLRVIPHVIQMIHKIPWAEEWVASREATLSLNQEDRLTLYYASLFHDLGKQDTFSQDEVGKIHFYHHESFSEERAKRIMERLKFSNQMQHRILHLIRHHMRILNLSMETKESALKRLVQLMREETPLLVLHTLADKEASRGILSIQIDEVVERNCLRILQCFKEKGTLHPPVLVTGYDVMNLGVHEGPAVGQLLNFIREQQIEGKIKTREEALEGLRRRVETIGTG